MNKLKKIESIGLKVTWKLINIGLNGDDEIPMQFSIRELSEYLNERLCYDDIESDNIIKLLLEIDDVFSFEKILCELANSEKTDINVQKSKWKLYMLHELLYNPNQDFFQSLLDIMHFWTNIENMDICPHDFPSAEEFNENTYKSILKINQMWLKEALMNITMVE